MAFCKNCGRKVDDETRFCPNCGTLIERDELNVSVESDNDADNAKTRRQVYVGLIRKCPSCGAELPSNAAVCPQCGFELNTRKGAQALQEFSQELNAIEDKIAAEGTKNRGWSTWKTWQKIGWVLLNIYTFCLPIIIPAILRQIRVLTIKPSPKLTAMEERKAKTIENYVVPNEKGAIIESLRFIRTKVEALNKQSKSERLMYWMNLWAVKAGQINSIASGSLQGDPDVEHQYKGILKISNGTNKSMRVGAGIKLALLLLVIIIPVSAMVSFVKTVRNYSSSNETTTESVTQEDAPADTISNKDARVANGYNTIEVGGFSLKIPDYYGDNAGDEDRYLYYAETGEGTVLLSVEAVDAKATDDEFLLYYDQPLNKYIEGMRNSEVSIDVTEGGEKRFKTGNGYVAVLKSIVFKITVDDMTVTSDGYITMINNPEEGKILLLFLGQSRQSQYDYTKGYVDMIGSAEVVSN